MSSERLDAAASRLIEVFRRKSHNPPAEEKARLKLLLATLKKARTVAGELSLTNHQRVFGHPIEQSSLDSLISETERAITKPLPKKSKQENLYRAMEFDYMFATRTETPPRLARTDTPNEFQQFMAKIVAAIEGSQPEDWQNFVVRTTKHYKRVVQKAEK